MAKKPAFEEGTCIWINETGGIRPRVFRIIEDVDDKVIIDFGNGEAYKVRRRNIRAKRLVIWQTKNEIKVQDPDRWKDMALKKYDIKELRFNLQNFAIQEGRASIHRWTLPLDKITKLSPLFKLLMICLVVGVIGWAAMKFGTYALDLVMKSRIIDCNSIIPRPPVPIGVPVGGNVTG